jgi:hypothetical protein
VRLRAYTLQQERRTRDRKSCAARLQRRAEATSRGWDTGLLRRAAFIGVAERGPVGEAVKIFHFTEYQNRYGGFIPNSFLSHAAYQFFNNGGTQCYIVRVAGGANGAKAK